MDLYVKYDTEDACIRIFTLKIPQLLAVAPIPIHPIIRDKCSHHSPFLFLCWRIPAFVSLLRLFWSL